MRRPEAPAPRTSIETVAALPSWLLRVALGLTTGLAGLAAGPDGTAAWAIIAAIVLLLVARPHGTLTALGCAVLAGMYVLAATADPWQLPVLVLTTHLLLALGALADATSWRARIEAGVLRDALPSFLAIQGAAQVAGAGAAVLQGAAPVPWLIVVALAGLGALAWRLVHQLSRRP